jgi:hypothetical protein
VVVSFVFEVVPVILLEVELIKDVLVGKLWVEVVFKIVVVL